MGNQLFQTGNLYCSYWVSITGSNRIFYIPVLTNAQSGYKYCDFYGKYSQIRNIVVHLQPYCKNPFPKEVPGFKKLSIKNSASGQIHLHFTIPN